MATQRAGGRVADWRSGRLWGGRPRTSDVRYGTPVLCTHRVDFVWLFVWSLFCLFQWSVSFSKRVTNHKSIHEILTLCTVLCTLGS